MSRWVELYATTNSGKTLFVCKMCGRQSVTPDKDCPTPPSVVSWKNILPCIVLEELAEAVEEAVESTNGLRMVETQMLAPDHGHVRYRSVGGFAGPEYTVYIKILDERIAALVAKFMPVVETGESEDRGRLGH